MTKKNYYEVLGIKKYASEDQIKQAFRKLVRQFHPDVSDDPNAATKMAEINNAYEVLSDKKKRSEYDATVFNPFSRFSEFTNASRFTEFTTSNSQRNNASRWDDLKEHLGENSPFGSSSFRFDDIFSAFGYKDKSDSEDEDTDKDSDRVQSSFAKFKKQPKNNLELDQETEINIDLQSVYTGDSYTIKLNVPVRLANGDITHNQTDISFKVPKGTINKQKIRIKGQGSVNLAGDTNGDLLLNIKIDVPENIRLDGADVYQTINVFPWEAALGTELKVDTPAGEFEITVPKLSEAGSMLRLKDKGIPSSPVGDLFLVLNIVNPDIKNEFSDKQKQAFEELQSAFFNSNKNRP